MKDIIHGITMKNVNLSRKIIVYFTFYSQYFKYIHIQLKKAIILTLQWHTTNFDSALVSN